MFHSHCFQLRLVIKAGLTVGYVKSVLCFQDQLKAFTSGRRDRDIRKLETLLPGGPNLTYVG